MNKHDLNEEYWTKRWQRNETQWDLGAPSPPLKTYIDRLTNRNMHILIPGAGMAWEGIYLFEKGFCNTFILDISIEPISKLKSVIDSKFHANLIHCDFFKFSGKFDLILEQTFFSALHPSLRVAYVNKMYDLLNTNGKLCGVVFNDPGENDKPPYAALTDEYKQLFNEKFVGNIELCYNSIPPRANRELFLNLTKK